MTPNEEILGRFAVELGDTVPAIIHQYTLWHAVTALVWIVIGAALIAAAAKWKGSDDASKDYSDLMSPKQASILARALALIIGLLLIGSHVADLVAPRAIAVHQLITDVRRG